MAQELRDWARANHNELLALLEILVMLNQEFQDRLGESLELRPPPAEECRRRVAEQLASFSADEGERLRMLNLLLRAIGNAVFDRAIAFRLSQ